jgi:DNA polymerase III subunit epsilon
MSVEHFERIAKCRDVARRWIESGAVILDTETTGLDDAAQIVEVSAIDCTGTVLIDTLVKPIGRIPSEAVRIHGITDSAVDHAPAWSVVLPQLAEIVRNRPLVIYNAGYDVRLIQQTSERYALPEIEPHSIGCAMMLYAEYWGVWDDHRHSWKWQKLSAAAIQQRVPAVGAHRALADCRMTLGVIRAIAGT